MNFYENEPVSLYLDNLELLENLNSSKQNIKIMRHPFLGIVLVINGEIQHIQNYQCPYHELLVHLPASFIKNPKSVLILGGGSLFAAYEVLKYPSIESVTLCDYDASVLKLMEKYYCHARIVRQDSRFTYLEQEGLFYINKCHEKYDLIINDCFNLLELSINNNFSAYLRLKELLTDDGVCSDIIYRHIFDGLITHNSICKIKALGNIAISLVSIPEYPGILHIETIWGKNKNISQTCNKVFNNYQLQIMKEGNSPFGFFSPENIPFYLYIPPYIKSQL